MPPQEPQLELYDGGGTLRGVLYVNANNNIVLHHADSGDEVVFADGDLSGFTTLIAESAQALDIRSDAQVDITVGGTTVAQFESNGLTRFPNGYPVIQQPSNSDFIRLKETDNSRNWDFSVYGNGDFVIVNPGNSPWIRFNVSNSNVEFPSNNVTTDGSFIDGNDTILSGRPVSFSEAVTNYADGLSNEEIWRLHLDPGETLAVYRLEWYEKGGAQPANVSVRVYDESDASVVASAGGTNVGSPAGTSTTGADCTLDLTNTSGGARDVSVNMSGVIYG